MSDHNGNYMKIPGSPDIEEEFLNLVAHLGDGESSAQTNEAGKAVEHPRTSSAPPELELQEEQLFAFRPMQDYARFFTDIRCDKSYYSFYNSYKGPIKLPPPLEPSFLNFYKPVAVKDSSSGPADESNPVEVSGKPSPMLAMKALLTASEHLAPMDLADGEFLSNTPQLLSAEAPYPRIEYGGIEEGSSMSITKRNFGLMNKSHLQKSAIIHHMDEVHSRQDSEVLAEDDELNGLRIMNGNTPPEKQESKVEAVAGGIPQPAELEKEHNATSHVVAESPSPGDVSVRKKNGVPVSRGKPDRKERINGKNGKKANGDLPDAKLSEIPTDVPARSPTEVSSVKSPMETAVHIKSEEKNGEAKNAQPVPRTKKQQEQRESQDVGDATQQPVQVHGQPQQEGNEADDQQMYYYRPQRPVCRYFQGGYCQYGSNCQYLHILPTQAPGAPLESPVAPSQRTPPSKTKKEPQKYTSLKQMIGEIYPICKDHQKGSRFLQKKLEEGNLEEIAIIFGEVIDHVVELMTDPFGNYFVQKLMENVSVEQNFEIIKKSASELVNISLNVHGTRVVQKMVDCLKTPEQTDLVVASLHDNVVKLIKDLNGNHVIQRCLQKLRPKFNQFLYDSVAGNCVEIATHKHGCCVMQRCIDHASPSQRQMLIEEIIRNAVYLVEDPYGNYVVQYIIDLKDENVIERLANALMKKIVPLSTQKFSSNVIEKCIQNSGSQVRSKMIRELCGAQNLQVLLQDPFANYVVQTALTLAEDADFKLFTDKIKPLLPKIKGSPQGKRIQLKMNRAAGKR